MKIGKNPSLWHGVSRKAMARTTVMAVAAAQPLVVVVGTTPLKKPSVKRL
jgi:hypothetical protein